MEDGVCVLVSFDGNNIFGKLMNFNTVFVALDRKRV